MTVYRVGPSEDKEQHTVSLGKVLVTTDDLDALTDILRHSIYSEDAIVNKPKPLRHKVEFDGGYFDEIADLPTLTDEEARSLKIEGRDVQVILSPERAVAIGDKKKADDIYKLWARSRQTKEPPRNRRLSDHPLVPYLMVSVLLTFAVLATFETNRGLWAYFVVGTLTFIPVAAFVGLIYLGLNTFQRFTPDKFLRVPRPSYAVIVPYSLDEYRKNKSTNRYPRLQTIITAISVVVAVLAISATIVVAYYKP